MFHDLNLTLPEVVAIIIALSAFVSVWVSIKVKIARIETTVNLKIAAIELSIATYIQSNSESVHCSFADNKEEHRTLMADVKEIRGSVNQISVEIAKINR